MSTLHLFDIDGTLTRSSSVDHSCYIDAFKNTFNITISVDNWCVYPYVTDWGLAQHIWQHEYGDAIPSLELELLKSEFMKLLRQRYVEAPEHITEIPGAVHYFTQLVKSGKKVAFATGCWKESALFKLDKIGIDAAAFPLGTSNDDPSRVNIMLSAIEKSTNHYGHHQSVIYYGDGSWDYHACKELNIPLIGIDGEHTGKLKSLGHDEIHHDYFELLKTDYVHT